MYFKQKVVKSVRDEFEKQENLTQHIIAVIVEMPLETQ